MRIGVLTSLFPSPARPRQGIFAQRRWQKMAERGHEVRIVQPTPRAPWPLSVLSPERFGQHAARPRHGVRGGLDVSCPRYLHISGRSRGNARRFAASGFRALTGSAEFSPEVVVCDYAWPAAAAAPALRAAGIRCVVSGRGSDVLEVAGEAGLGPELAHYLQVAGAWCAVSQDLVDAMDQLAGERRGRLVPNGVDAALFDHRRRDERLALRLGLGWSESDLVVLVVGHLIPRKDPLLALAAFVELARDEPRARLVFVGRGPLQGQLEAELTRRKLDGRVTLLGELEPGPLADLYAAADVLLLTSTREGRPNVVLEALSAGLPVVATDAGGTRELLTQGPLDVADSRNPGELAAAMRELLKAPPSPKELAASVADLSWDRGLATLERLLEEAPT